MTSVTLTYILMSWWIGYMVRFDLGGRGVDTAGGEYMQKYVWCTVDHMNEIYLDYCYTTPPFNLSTPMFQNI